MSEALSRLTRERPDLWLRAVSLATNLTGYTYAHKADGGLLACGYSGPPPTPASNLEEYQRRIDRWKKDLEDPSRMPSWQNEKGTREWIEEMESAIAKIKREHPELDKKAAPVVYVPEGEMEWLLHEVGHWIAATPEERLLPNYGYNHGILLNGLGAARELQAWGFEDIVLSPCGPSRLFASPTQREGAAFDWHGPLPDFALRHVGRRLRDLNTDVQAWRAVYGEWIRWNCGRWTTLH